MKASTQLDTASTGKVASAAHGAAPSWRPVAAGKSYGGLSEREIPGPIPNPEVKPLSADGTATEGLWESRTSPDILSRRPPASAGGLLCISDGWPPLRATRQPCTRRPPAVHRTRFRDVRPPAGPGAAPTVGVSGKRVPRR